MYFLIRFQGFLFPKTSKIDEPSWICDSCPAGAVEASTIEKEVQALLDEKDALDRSNLDAYLEFYRKCGKVLHDNHYLLNACRRWILPLYCRVTRANVEVEGERESNQISVMPNNTFQWMVIY